MLPNEVRQATMAILKGNARADGHRVQRVLGNVEWDMDLVGESLVQTAEHGATASEVDAVVYNVGIELWGCLLEGGHNGGLYLRHALLQCVSNFLI